MYERRTDLLPATMHSPHSKTSLPKLCLDIIILTPHLQDLSISSDYFRYPDFRVNFRKIVDSGRLQDLQSSTLCFDVLKGKHRHINAVHDWGDALFTPFLAPDIKSVSAVMTLKPDALKSLRVSTITRLVLHHCQLEDFDLHGLLAATPSLAYLEYHAAIDYPWFTSKSGSNYGNSRGVGLEPLFDALHHVSETLGELIASQQFQEDSYYFQRGWVAGLEPPSSHKYGMSKLKHLHTLRIPYPSLLGWTRKEGQSWEWHNILPASLRQITLTDDLCENFSADCWTDETLMPIFESLLAWMARSTLGSQPPKFELLLLQLDDDFNRPVRQRLSEFCAQYGVLCSIEKLSEDRIRPTFVHMPRGRRRRHLRGRARH